MPCSLLNLTVVCGKPHHGLLASSKQPVKYCRSSSLWTSFQRSPACKHYAVELVEPQMMLAWSEIEVFPSNRHEIRKLHQTTMKISWHEVLQKIRARAIWVTLSILAGWGRGGGWRTGASRHLRLSNKTGPARHVWFYIQTIIGEKIGISIYSVQFGEIKWLFPLTCLCQ